LNEKLITRAESERRLTELFAHGRYSHYPSNRRDRHIILKSIIMTLKTSRTYTKQGIKRKLTEWIKAMHEPEGLDNSTLLEHLLEEGYLRCDREGARFWVPETRPDSEIFSPDVEEIDVLGVVKKARLDSTGTETGNKTRERIVSEAAKLFWKRGVAATTMQDIASASGLSVSIVRSYFSDEDTLYSTLLCESALEWHRKIIKSDKKEATLRERLIILVKVKMDLARAKSPAFRLLTKEWLERAETGANPRLDIGISKPLVYMERLVAQAVKRGEIRNVNPKKAVWYILGLGFLYGNRMINKFLDTSKPLTDKDVVEYVDLILKGLSK